MIEIKNLLQKELDAELVLLYYYRVAVDHYILNPTIIRIYNKEIIRIVTTDKQEIRIGMETLQKAIEASRIILSRLVN